MYSCRYGDALDSDEFQMARLVASHVETKLNRLANFKHEFIERCGISVATGQLRNGSHIHSFFVPLDHDIKLAWHLLQFSSRELIEGIPDLFVRAK